MKPRELKTELAARLPSLHAEAHSLWVSALDTQPLDPTKLKFEIP